MRRKYRHDVRPMIIPVGPSIAYVSLSGGKYSLIDREDAERVGHFNWYGYYSIPMGGYYAAKMEWRDEKRKVVRLHAFILDCPKGMVVDHRNHDTLDNRRCNIWVCSQKENMANLRPDHRTGKHGNYRRSTLPRITIYFHNRDKRWRVRLRHLGTEKQIGSFATREEADRFKAQIGR